MRVLIDAHMVGEQETGNESYILGLLEGFRRSSFPDEFVVAATQPDLVRARLGSDARFRVAPVSGAAVRRLLFDLPAVARRERADIMHVTYAGPLRSRAALVVTVHDVSFRRHPEWFSPRDRLVLNAGVPWTSRRAGAVVTISQFSRSEILDALGVPPERLYVVPIAAGSDFRPLAPEAVAAELKARRIERPYVLAVGNLQPRKNMARLVAAFAAARRRHALPHRLVIAGKALWRESEVFRSVERTGIQDRVMFTGHVDGPTLASLYAGADLFAYPSLYEGFGLPILEAMACGTPVLCSAAASMPEVAGDAALLVDPVDVDAIAEAVGRILTNPALRETLRTKGLSRAAEFSWQKTAELTRRVYERAAGSGGGQ